MSGKSIAQNPHARRVRPDRPVPVTDDLRAPRDFRVIAVARKFSGLAKDVRARSRNACHGDGCSSAGAAAPRSRRRCRGQLPRRAPGRARQRHRAVHRDFVARLLGGDRRRRPRDPADAHLDPRRCQRGSHRVSQTKRGAERLIVASGLPYAILRPGFVVRRRPMAAARCCARWRRFRRTAGGANRRRRSSRSRSRTSPPPSHSSRTRTREGRMP